MRKLARVAWGLFLEPDMSLKALQVVEQLQNEFKVGRYPVPMNEIYHNSSRVFRLNGLEAQADEELKRANQHVYKVADQFENEEYRELWLERRVNRAILEEAAERGIT